MNKENEPKKEKKKANGIQHIAVIAGRNLRCLSCGFEESLRNIKLGARIPICVPKKHLQN